MSLNPAASLRGPAHSVRQGRTPVLDPVEARTLLDSIDYERHVRIAAAFVRLAMIRLMLRRQARCST